MNSKALLFSILLVFITHKSVKGQDIVGDSCKKLFRQNVLIQYWGEGIPQYILKKYSCFFEEVLKNEDFAMKDISFVKAFPVNHTNTFMDSIEFIEIDDSTYTTNDIIPLEYCVIVFKTLSKNGKAYNHVFVLDSSLNKIIRKDIVISKVRWKKEIYYDVHDPISLNKAVFRFLVSEKKKNAILPKPETKKEYEYYFDNKMRLKRKRTR